MSTASTATASANAKAKAEASIEMTEVDAETFGKLHQIKQVLERWEISGINRKLQLKPRKWEKCSGQGDDEEKQRTAKATATVSAPENEVFSSAEGEGKTAAAAAVASAAPAITGERAAQLLLILKWGGELTNLGQRQAIELGNSFRTIMYPDSGTGGLLRLHRSEPGGDGGGGGWRMRGGVLFGDGGGGDGGGGCAGWGGIRAPGGGRGRLRSCLSEGRFENTPGLYCGVLYTSMYIYIYLFFAVFAADGGGVGAVLCCVCRVELLESCRLFIGCCKNKSTTR